MVPTRRLVNGREITLSEAIEDQSNILHTLSYHQDLIRFLEHLRSKRKVIEALTAVHLGLPSSTRSQCHVVKVKEWLWGSFNVCVPIEIHGPRQSGEKPKKVIMRCPLPFRVGDAFRPGNGDEKVRCEAGTYAWLQSHCPEVPIPDLHGFGMSTGLQFTASQNLSFFKRVFHFFRRQALAFLGYSVPSRYVPSHSSNLLDELQTGYLLIDYIDDSRGVLLSESWDENKKIPPALRPNLLKSLAQLTLSLSKIPLLRIGSFVIDDDGVLCLQNRPLASDVHWMENEEIPIDIPRDWTYTTTDSYVVDLLSCYERRLRYQPNAIFHEGDCISQMTTLTLMKALFPWIFRRELRRGPFIFTLTDLHESNIIVDSEGNITCLLDLEWGVSRPAEMFDISLFWRSTPDGLIVDDQLRKEFMALLKEEEQNIDCPKFIGSLSMSAIMKRTWETQAFWFALALRSPEAIFPIFDDHISTKYADVNQIDLAMSLRRYWPDFDDFIAKKVFDKDSYDRRLREAFGE